MFGQCFESLQFRISSSKTAKLAAVHLIHGTPYLAYLCSVQYVNTNQCKLSPPLTQKLTVFSFYFSALHNQINIAGLYKCMALSR